MLKYQIKKFDIERFFKRIKYSANGCWKWTGTVVKFGKGGYTDDLPYFFLNGQKIPSRRFAYLMMFGECPDAKLIHSCNDKKCVNPLHAKEYIWAKYDKRIKRFYQTKHFYQTKKRKKISLKVINKIILLRKLNWTMADISIETGIKVARIGLILKMARYCRDEKLNVKSKELARRVNETKI